MRIKRTLTSKSATVLHTSKCESCQSCISGLFLITLPLLRNWYTCLQLHNQTRLTTSPDASAMVLKYNPWSHCKLQISHFTDIHKFDTYVVDAILTRSAIWTVSGEQFDPSYAHTGPGGSTNDRHGWRPAAARVAWAVNNIDALSHSTIYRFVLRTIQTMFPIQSVEILSAFVELLKVTVSSCLSFRPSGCLNRKTRLPLHRFSWNTML